ncbi:ferredoxin [Mycobacteroides abscessus]|uniref:ferredoxin n=2 Tax=Mycobacteroides abscessus TaxID=36809 RepID=UPI0011A72CF1|nr:(4Fe-4S)-binding protein [Mycobacteroides abscessus]
MLRADRDQCCGSGMCVLIEPRVFTQDSDGLVVIDEHEAAQCDPGTLVHAVQCCPAGALWQDRLSAQGERDR